MEADGSSTFGNAAFLLLRAACKDHIGVHVICSRIVQNGIKICDLVLSRKKKTDDLVNDEH
jgi:hypothetical protein